MHAGRAIARAKDQRIYAAMCAAADAGARAPTADELCELLDEDGSGGPSISGTVLMLRRLEERGLIRIRRFQRYREVQIVATGKWTAAAPCTTPHWRERPTAAEPITGMGMVAVSDHRSAAMP